MYIVSWLTLGMNKASQYLSALQDLIVFEHDCELSNYMMLGWDSHCMLNTGTAVNVGPCIGHVSGKEGISLLLVHEHGG